MKALARLAVLVLITPALLAQTPTTQPVAPQTSDKKPANAQGESTTPQTATVPADGAQTAAQGTEPAKPRVPGPYPVLSEKAKQRARQLYGYFASGQTGQLYAAFAPALKKQSPESKISTISKQVTATFGSPTDTLSESFLPSMGGPVTLYSHTTVYSKPDSRAQGGKARSAVMVVLGVDEQGELTDFTVLPMPPTPRDEYSDYQDVAKLHLPFNGEWIVMQGGRTMYDNANAASDESRYTVSFLYVKDGMAFDGNGRKNTDYYCYGQPILAPAAGTIVQASNTYQDHAPGRAPDIQSRGNYVVIAHGNSEFSLIPYMKSGSVKVKLGQRVKQGDAVGACGNSGSSQFPHVEYSLQNSKGFPLPKTLPAQFVDYVADGKPVPVGEPLRGQTVANAPKATPVQAAGKP